MSRTTELFEHVDGLIYHGKAIKRLLSVDDDEVTAELYKRSDAKLMELIGRWKAKGGIGRRVLANIGDDDAKDAAREAVDMFLETLR